MTANRLTEQELMQGIEDHKPWYQCIEFPEYGITTTDRDESTFFDNAGDNKYGDMTSEEASRQRPIPTWNRIKNFILPYITDMDVLEVGCAHGFYSLAFANCGAKNVLGIDQSGWVKNAIFANNVWGLSLRLVVKFLWRVGYSPSAMSFLFYPKETTEKGPKRMCLVLDKTKDQSFVDPNDQELWGGRDYPGRFY